MKIRTTIAGLLALAIGLSVTGCTAEAPQAAPAATPLPAAKCGYLKTTDYVGQPEEKVGDIKALGWTVNVRYSETPIGAPEVDRKAIFSVTGSSDCVAIVEVVLPSPKISVTTSSSAPSAPSGPLTTVTDGTYLVGTDMEVGSYKSAGGHGCYWARMKDDAGENIIANNLSDGPARFTAKKGEYVQISRCMFTKI